MLPSLVRSNFLRKLCLLIPFAIGIALPARGQSCLQEYFPQNIGGAKVVFVTESWGEFNKRHLDICNEYQLPAAPLSGQKKFARYRSKTIKLARKVSSNIIVLSNDEFNNINTSLLDSILFVVKEIQIVTEYSVEAGTYNTKSCYQFEDIRNKKLYRLICHKELVACIKEDHKGKVFFPDYILTKCH